MNTPPAQTEPLVAYYDFKTCPITFDFVHYIAAAAGYARLQGNPVFDLVLIADGFRNITPREQSYTMVERDWRVWNLTVEVCKIVPYIQNLTIARRPLSSWSTNSYPPNFHPTENNIVPYSLKMVKQLHDQGIDVRIFQPSTYAYAAAKRMYPRAGKPLFTLTLRKAGFDPVRDSQLDEWYRFAKVLEARGCQVVVVPDQDDTLGERVIRKYDWDVVDAAAMSVDLRLALYRRADMNYVTNGGIIGLFLYSKVPFFWYSVTVPDSQIASPTFFRAQGLEPGGKYAWLGPNQEMVWEPDTFESLVKSLDRIIFKAPAPAVAAS